MADKVRRVTELALWLVDADIVRPSEDTPQAKVALHNSVRDAASLCKADLVTEMVGEFPELQGLMGGYYARAEGLADAVADAIRDHYKPVGQGDDVPTAPVTVAVSLADKLDSIAAFFGIGMAPTGSGDPFALRRSALGAIRLLSVNNLRLNLLQTYNQIAEGVTYSLVLREQAPVVAQEADVLQRTGINPGILLSEEQQQRLRNRPEIVAIDQGFVDATPSFIRFFADRLKVQQKEAGVRHDLIDAVFALGGEDDLVRLLARVHALQAFVATPDGANLLAGYKRAANILKKEDWQGIEGEIAQTGEEDPLANVDDPDLAAAVAAKMAERHEKVLSYTPEPAEKALIDALGEAGPRAADAVAAEDFAGAMAALASLRAPIDAFFDQVTVNDDDRDKRAARLTLLARFREAVHQVADFSRIEG